MEKVNGEEPKELGRLEQLRGMPETLGWKDEDVRWLSLQPPELANIAMRYGRAVFELVGNAGAGSYGLGILMQVCQRKLQVRQGLIAVHTLQNLMDGFIELALKGINASPEEFIKCREDIHQMLTLAAVEPGKSASGLILPPN